MLGRKCRFKKQHSSQIEAFLSCRYYLVRSRNGHKVLGIKSAKGYQVEVQTINSAFCGFDRQIKVRLIIAATGLLLNQNYCSKHILQLYFTLLLISQCTWFSIV